MPMRPVVPVDRNVLELARERLAETFDTFDHVAVAFSGGKDSTVCLQLALEAAENAKALPLHVVFFDEEAVPTETIDYVRRTANRDDVALDWYCIPVKHRNGCSNRSPYWYPWAPEDREKWVRELPPEGITELAGFPPTPPEARLTIPDTKGLLFDPQVHGTVGYVMGIRAAESITRHRAMVQNRRSVPWMVPYTDGTSKGNMQKVYPIYDWKTEDVWTAPHRFGWDYNHAYDLMDKIGMSPQDQRCAPPYGEEPMRNLFMFKQCFPDIWDKMSERVPGASTAALYSATELYGYGSLPPKPEGMSWEQFTFSFLEQYSGKERKQVQHRIGAEIRTHQRKTDDPILPTAPHPETGLTWSFLIKLALRGDFKNRKQPHTAISHDPERKAHNWERYNRELEKVYGRA